MEWWECEFIADHIGARKYRELVGGGGDYYIITCPLVEGDEEQLPEKIEKVTREVALRFKKRYGTKPRGPETMHELMMNINPARR